MKIRVHFTNGETKDINTNVPFDSIAKSIDNANSNAKWLVFSKILVLIDNVNYIEPLEENQP